MPTTKAKGLEELFSDTLKDIYFAEKQILRALPKMAKSASSAELSEAFEKHRQETEGHVERLEQIFEAMGKPARGKTCDAIVGILEEGKEIMEDYAGDWLWTQVLPLPRRRSSTTRSRATGPCELGRTNWA